MFELTEEQAVIISIIWAFFVVACYDFDIFLISFIGFVVSEITIQVVRITEQTIKMYVSLIEYEKANPDGNNDST